MTSYHYDQHDTIGGWAAADLTTRQFCAVDPDPATDDGFVLAAAGDCYGILENPAAQGEAVTVYIGGIVPARSGAAYGKNAKLTTDAQGRVVQVAPAAGATARYQYRAESASTQADEVVAVRREVGIVQG